MQEKIKFSQEILMNSEWWNYEWEGSSVPRSFLALLALEKCSLIDRKCEVLFRVLKVTISEKVSLFDEIIVPNIMSFSNLHSNKSFSWIISLNLFKISNWNIEISIWKIQNKLQKAWKLGQIYIIFECKLAMLEYNMI